MPPVFSFTGELGNRGQGRQKSCRLLALAQVIIRVCPSRVGSEARFCSFAREPREMHFCFRECSSQFENLQKSLWRLPKLLALWLSLTCICCKIFSLIICCFSDSRCSGLAECDIAVKSSGQLTEAKTFAASRCFVDVAVRTLRALPAKLHAFFFTEQRMNLQPVAVLASLLLSRKGLPGEHDVSGRVDRAPTSTA
jgi:hypothetical protein